MYREVIVGVDGRQGGRDAAALAELLSSSESSVSLVHVAPAKASRASGVALEFADDDDLRELLTLERRLCGGAAQIRRMAAPSIGSGLEQVAAAAGADLIVVGSSRRHGRVRLLSGDDVCSVLRQTSCAVAVAPAGYARAFHRLDRIGVSFDESAPSQVALAHGGLLADEHGAELVVRHLVEPSYDYGAAWPGALTAPRDPESELAGARARQSTVDGVTIDYVYGPMHESTGKLTADLDLLVCGSHRRGAMGRLAAGSVSERLVRHADLPLVIAPAVDGPAVERWRALRATVVS